MSDPARESFSDQHHFSPAALSNCGFEKCRNAKLSRQIYNIKPFGSKSSLYDAIMLGLQNIKQLYLMIEESGKAINWRIDNIIICDGKDTCSKHVWKDVIKTYRQVSNRMKLYDFKTIFIAYNVTPQQYQELLFLFQLDPDNVRVYPASFYHSQYEQLNLGKLMKRIRKDVGLLFKKNMESKLFNMKPEPQENDQLMNPYGIAEKVFNYALLFTISGRSELDGQIWSSVCNNVNNVIRYLGDTDLIGCLIYTDKVRYFKDGEFTIKEEKKKLKEVEKKVLPPPPMPPAPPKPQNVYVHNPVNINANKPPPPPQQLYVPPPQPYIAHPPQLQNNYQNPNFNQNPQYIPPKPGQVNNIKPPQPQQFPNKVYINGSQKSNSNNLNQSLLEQSRVYTLCDAGTCCSKFCVCILTLLTLLIIGGIVFLLVR